MTFVVSKNVTTEWPVKVQVPSNGAFEQKTFKATFKALPESTTARLRDEAKESGNEADFGRQLIKQATLGWSGIVDETNTPIEFSQENLDALIDIPFVGPAFIIAYFEMVSGRKAKN